MDEIFLEGKKLISASRAAEMSGYTQDYIGELVRAGKFLGKKVGRVWYVEEDTLHEYQRIISQDKISRADALSEQSKKTLRNFSGSPSLALKGNNEDSFFDEDPPKIYEPISYSPPQESHYAEYIRNFLVPDKGSSQRLREVLEGGNYIVKNELSENIKESTFLDSPISVIRESNTNKEISDAHRFNQLKKASFGKYYFFKTAFKNTLAVVFTFFIFFGISSATLSFYRATPLLPSGLSQGEQERIAQKLTLLSSNLSSKISNVFENFSRKVAEGGIRAEASLGELSAELSSRLSESISSFFLWFFPSQKSDRQTNDTQTAENTPSRQSAQVAVLETSEKISKEPSPPSSSRTPSPVPQKVVIEKTIVGKTIEKISAGISREEFNSRFQELSGKFSSDILRILAQLSGQYSAPSGLYQVIAHTNKIDQLSGTIISSPRITGGSWGSADVSGILSGTFSGTIAGANITATTTFSTQATTTFAGGIDLSAGCFAVSGVCITGGGGSGGSGGNSKFASSTDNTSVYPNFAWKIGIGTTTSAWQLQVASGTAPQLALSDPDAGADLKHWIMRSVGGNLYFATSSDAYATSTTAALTITKTGFVGIGNTSPASRLDIQNSATSSAIVSLRDPLGNVSLELRAGTSTLFNTFVGFETGKVNTTGIYNTVTGYQALSSNTSGSHNTANGLQALYSNTTGANNTAIGRSALFSNNTGSSNTATGYQALYNNNTGINNTASGYQALFSNTSGSYNTAYGQYALLFNTIGATNTAIGAYSLYNNSAGSYNIANGSYALYNNTTGSSSVAIGWKSLFALNTTGASSTALGSWAGKTVTTGINNLFLGDEADTSLATISGSTAIGSHALVGISNAMALGGDTNSAYGVSVGIGTSTPFWKLQIASSTLPQLALTDPTAGTNLKHWVARSVGGNLYFATSSDLYATSSLASLSISANGLLTIQNGLLVNSSTTLQNFTALTSTTTNSTS
ncbi:MAG: hypothetical protein AAB545_02900, partial [Patescibacteria group bacterium]